MQFLLVIVEMFFPEIARAMSGPSSLPLRRRFLRAGIGLMLVPVCYVVARLCWRVLVERQQVSPEIFLPSEQLALGMIFLLGFVSLLLSRASASKGSHGS